MFQPAGESIVINNSNDRHEQTNLCNRHNIMRNDSRSMLPSAIDKIASACEQQPELHQQQEQRQTNVDQPKNQTSTNQRDSGYGSSPDSGTVDLQTLP